MARASASLVHAGALVAAGYWERPEQTAARFRPDPRPGRAAERVVYSGDLVRRDADGRHTFVARSDRMIKVQGYRISPDEVAAAFADAPGATAVVAFGRDSGAAGQEIVLVAASEEVVVWDVHSGSERTRLRGQGRVERIAFSLDGQRLATAGAGGVTLWDTATWRPVVRFGQESPVPIQELRFSADGRGLLQLETEGDRIGLVREAAPWRSEDLPGDASIGWRLRFDRWKLARIEAARP